MRIGIFSIMCRDFSISRGPQKKSLLTCKWQLVWNMLIKFIIISSSSSSSSSSISNGNRTEWSPIRSVIIRVINKIGRPRSGSPICLITSMITVQIGRHEVLLPINHNFNKICNIIGYFFKSKHEKFDILFC